jgi:hypothetical protein
MRMRGISRIPCARGADAAVSPREFEISAAASIDNTRTACIGASLRAAHEACARPVSSTGDTILSDNLSENFARKVRVQRSHAEEARNNQKAEAGNDDPLSRPASKVRSEIVSQPPARRWRNRGRHHQAEAAGGIVPAAVRQQPCSDDRLRAG